MSRNKNNKQGKKGLSRILAALIYSKDGFFSAWKDEAAFKQVFIFAVICILLAFFIGENWIQKTLLILPCMLSLVIELINSAIENAVDFTSFETHPLAKKAKDMGSAAQFFVLIFWIGVWVSFLWENFSSNIIHILIQLFH